MVNGFKYDVFISYSHRDEKWVRNILLPILEKQGLKICIDYRDFIAGKPAIINMQDASEASRHTLLVLTPRWVESEWTLFESILSRTDDPSGLQRRTIPLLLEKCSPPKFVSMLSWVDFTNQEHEDEAWQNLTKSLTDSGNSKDAETSEQNLLSEAITIYMRSIKSQIELSSKNLDSKSPYKALLEYDIRDASFFFGRESESKELIDAINRNPLTVLHAESGSGKTSLLKARIRPALFSEDNLPIYVRPHQNPIDISIKRALLPQLEQSSVWMNASLHTFTQGVTKLLDGKSLVIILDQFEEFFTLQTQVMRDQFIKQLAQCLDDDLLRVRWVISLRGEWLSKLVSFRPYVRNPIENNVFLETLKRNDADLAIRKPAEIKEARYENPLVAKILDELGPQKIYPPELQIVCSALYDARDNENLITQDLYDSLGGARGILHEHLNRVLNQKIPKDRVAMAQQVLSALVASDGSRISRSKSELEGELTRQKLNSLHIEDVLEQLVDSHLLRVEETNIGDQAVMFYELAHDYLTDKIELDPQSQNRKIAQELIDYKVRYYKRNNDLKLSSEELEFIFHEWDRIDISKEQIELVERSQARIGRSEFVVQLISVITFVVAALLFFSVFKDISALSPGYVLMFWGSVILFLILGYKRGWKKELLVTFSAILALSVNNLIRKYIPLVVASSESDISLFWVRINIFLLLIYFGYQTVKSIPRLAAHSIRKHSKDGVFGALLGAINGYLIIGSFLFYLDKANYPFPNFITSPTGEFVEKIKLVMMYMPPTFMGEPTIYFAVILLQIFVIIVYI